MKKGQKMPEWLREKRRAYMKKHPLRYWLGKERLAMRGKSNPNYDGSAARGKPRPDLVKRMTEANPNKGKFYKDHSCYKEVKKHPFLKSIRELYKYRQWRSSIFERDNRHCVLCDGKEFIEVDHYPVKFIDIVRECDIKTLDEALDCKELWKISNGRTLCRECHHDSTWNKQAI